MNAGLRYEWDEAKRRANIAKHGVDFAAMEDFDWETAAVIFDDRHEEARWIAAGFIEWYLHVVVYTVRGETVRVISLREATPREKKHYDETQRRH